MAKECLLPPDISRDIYEAATGEKQPTRIHPFMALQRQMATELSPENLTRWKQQAEACPERMFDGDCEGCPVVSSLAVIDQKIQAK